MGTRRRVRWALPAVAALMAALLLVGPAFAGEFAEGEVYRLAAGQVVDDDLTVTAKEVYIDGTVQGDLVAFASYVEVNGTVEGDLISAAAEVRINGKVLDDARVAGAGVTVAGSVGDDLYAAAGGGEGAAFISPTPGRTVVQGLRIEPGATVGGSAYIGAGSAYIGGAVNENLAVGAGTATLAGPVGGDADLSVGSLAVSDAARVGGRLSYTSERETAIPPKVAEDVRFEQRVANESQPAQSPVNSYLWSAARIVLALLGFALLGWLLLRFVPAALRRPADAIAARPGQAALYGIAALAILFLVPVLSGLVFFAIVAFWGWFPAAMFALLLTAALVLAWTLSPLVTGLWLGRLVWPDKDRGYSDLAALVCGTILVLLLSALPWVGWLVGLASLTLALGGLLAASRGTYDAPAPRVTAAPMPV